MKASTIVKGACMEGENTKENKAEITGRAVGGHARAEVLSPERRSEIASKAAQARHTPPMPKATHSGKLKFADIPCFVLEDGRRVVSGRGMTVAIGMKGRGQGVSRISTHPAIKGYLSNELALAIQNPIKFAGVGSRETDGFEATVLNDLCEAILTARDAGNLSTEQEKRYAKYADIVIRSLARVGIIALVDEATGYQSVRPQDALQVYLEMLVRKELAAWAKKFPDEFYENIYKLKGWIWPGMGKNRYSVVGHYTNDLVFERLAPGLVEELKRKTPRDEKGNRPNKLHQWLTEEIGNPLLAQHLHSLIMFQRLAISNGYGWKRFVKMVDQVLPKRGSTLEMALPMPDGSNG